MRTANKLVRHGKVACPICKGLLKTHGSYPRHCLDASGQRYDGWVAQGHCESCRKYPAIMPMFLMPHKHYTAEVIEGAISETEAGNVIEHLGGYATDVSTMRRWVRQFRERGAWAVGWLISILIKIYDVHIGSLKLLNMTLLKQLARLLCEYPTSKSGGVIGRANIILTTQNCGFL